MAEVTLGQEISGLTHQPRPKPRPVNSRFGWPFWFLGWVWINISNMMTGRVWSAGLVLLVDQSILPDPFSLTRQPDLIYGLD